MEEGGKGGSPSRTWMLNGYSGVEGGGGAGQLTSALRLLLSVQGAHPWRKFVFHGGQDFCH